MFTLTHLSLPYPLSFQHPSLHFRRSTDCEIKIPTSWQKLTASGCRPTAGRLLMPPKCSMPNIAGPVAPPTSPDDVSNIITETLFEEMLPHRNNRISPAKGFYTWDAFITAARRYPAFGTTGTTEIRKRELAAFFGQTSHETTGGNINAPGGDLTWGYCHIRQMSPPSDYCQPSKEWPCVPGQRYFGRGPIQLTYNFNYGPLGEAVGLDLLSNPDLVATNAVLAFEAAIWFWMTPQYGKPSCHDVIIGKWKPTEADIEANRLPGYGVLTNIINPGECRLGLKKRVHSRIRFFERYCDMLGVTAGDNLDCCNQCVFP